MLYRVAPTPPTIDASERIVQIADAALLGYGIPKDSLVDAVRLVRSALHGFVDLELSGGFGGRRSAEASFSVVVDLLDEALARLGRAEGPKQPPCLPRTCELKVPRASNL